jgi:hypothetical protein
MSLSQVLHVISKDHSLSITSEITIHAFSGADFGTGGDFEIFVFLP